jgi:hypothetical protein
MLVQESVYTPCAPETARVSHQFNLGFGFARDAFAVRDNFGCGSIFGRRGDAEMHAETGGEIDEGIADVVAITDISELEAA